MPTYALTLLNTATPDELQASEDEQLDYLRELHGRGQLRLIGDFTQGDGQLWLLDVTDRMEAESLVRECPWIRDGLATWMLREWVERRFDSP